MIWRADCDQIRAVGRRLETCDGRVHEFDCDGRTQHARAAQHVRGLAARHRRHARPRGAGGARAARRLALRPAAARRGVLDARLQRDAGAAAGVSAQSAGRPGRHAGRELAVPAADDARELPQVSNT